MTQFLSDLNAEKNQRRKLQHTYIVLAILLTFVAGVVALADPSLSRCIVGSARSLCRATPTEAKANSALNQATT